MAANENLYVLMEGFLVVIDLAKFDSTDSFASENAPARLSSSAILNLPYFGMGCFKLNPKLILVGGEKREEGDTSEVISAEIYECDLYLKNCRPVKIRHLHDPKALPVVETIAGSTFSATCKSCWMLLLKQFLQWFFFLLCFPWQR